MKKKLIPSNDLGISQNAVAKHYGVNGGSVTAWCKQGCPRLVNGKFVLADVEKWLKQRDEKKADRASLKDQKTQAEIDRIRRDIASRDIDLSKQRDEVHSKSECCKSLTAVVSEAMQPLMSLHTQIKAAFPELPQNVIEAIAAKVDAAMEQIRSGLK